MQGVKALPAPELCTAKYVAHCVAGHVVVYAIGVHDAAGWLVFFRREPGEAIRPRFSFWHVAGDGPALHVVTPFSATTSFQSTRRIECVEVVDALGATVVAVEELSNASMSQPSH
jgi:hypothetical protein